MAIPTTSQRRTTRSRVQRGKALPSCSSITMTESYTSCYNSRLMRDESPGRLASSFAASTGTRRSPAVGERQGSLSLRVSFLERNLADGVGALPHACGGSAPRGWIEPQWLGGRRSQGHQTVERREQLTCRGAWLLQLGLAASSTRSVCPSSGLPGDASPALRPLEIDFCLRAIDSVSIIDL